MVQILKMIPPRYLKAKFLLQSFVKLLPLPLLLVRCWLLHWCFTESWSHFGKWVFPKLGVGPPNGWFIMENLKMDDLGAITTIFGNTQVSIFVEIFPFRFVWRFWWNWIFLYDIHRAFQNTWIATTIFPSFFHRDDLEISGSKGAPCSAETQAVGLDLRCCISSESHLTFGRGYESDSFPGKVTLPERPGELTK